MARKRRRSKKNKRPDDGFYLDDEGNEPLPKGEDFIDDNVFRLAKSLGVRVKRALFKDAGFACSKCGWQTTKLGLRGRNAMRAHLKRHVRDRRAKNHLRVYVWAALMLMFTVLVASIGLTLNPELVKTVIDRLDWSAAAGPILFGASLVAAFGLIGFEILYRKDPTKTWRVGYFISLVFTFAELASEAMMAFGVVGTHVAWPWYLSGLLPIIALSATRADFARTTLRHSRRELQPQSYFRRYRSITGEGDSEIMEIQTQIQSWKKEKQININDLKPWQIQALITLKIATRTS